MHIICGQGLLLYCNQQDGCEYLIAETGDGRWDLTDVYVLDNDTGIYARPDIASSVVQPQVYVEVPWVEEFLGDVIHDKQPWQKVIRHG